MLFLLFNPFLTKYAKVKNKVNESLNKFTEKTDIPVVIVLDNARNVFYPGLSNVTIFTGGLFLSMAALFTFLLIRAIKKKNDFYYEDLED